MGSPTAHASDTYSVAIVPQFPAVEIYRDWSPLLDRLKKETGLNFTLVVAASIPEFEDALLAGQPDFAYMNPYHQVMAKRAKGYLPLVRGGNLLTGVLVVRKDDPIKTVSDLNGKDIAFPAPNAFGASLWMRALLAEQTKIRINPVYVKTHSNVYRHVTSGRAAAGGGIHATLEDEPEEVRAHLRVLMETPGVPPHPLSAHPRVPEAVRKQVTEVLLRVAAEPVGQALMANVQMDSLRRADYMRDYFPLEKFGLEKYVVRASKP
ncbi:MAG: phosphate/phosphite/phosphonate ABC transporter substrate-binding protein [Polaromonas sp.]|nr:phosphate/phosphite/phosphonate ABC transporter substrate-binding protein [Polaromonas sp.]